MDSDLAKELLNTWFASFLSIIVASEIILRMIEAEMNRRRRVIMEGQYAREGYKRRLEVCRVPFILQAHQHPKFASQHSFSYSAISSASSRAKRPAR